MKRFNVDKERNKVEKELCKLGAKLSKPFIARAKELIVELSKFQGVKINHLIMGMGGYSLDATVPWKEIWNGQVEEGTHEFEFDTFRPRSNYAECYENINPGICKVAIELDEILEALTQDPYLQIFDINDEEMRKLLKA